MSDVPLTIHGRATQSNPQNRFEPLRLDREWDAFEHDPDAVANLTRTPTQVFLDTSRTILAHNDSPDVGFETSVNPYRGCEHGCVYCYARPTHEYLGFSAGLDFESKILVKKDAAELLRAELMKPSYVPDTIAFSGVTDCYQPIERTLQITRQCLSVCATFRNPVGIVTKNQLVTRDIDVLQQLAEHRAVVVMVPVTTLDGELARKMEPRTSTPRRRLEAISKLREAGIPVGVIVAPVIPGLTDHETPAILKAAANAGAQSASFVPLRLPYAVSTLFQEWLTQHFPDRKDKVLNRVRELRGGKLNDANFNSRMRGQGIWAEQFRAMFELGKKAAGLTQPSPRLSAASFRRPGEQMSLFGG